MKKTMTAVLSILAASAIACTGATSDSSEAGVLLDQDTRTPIGVRNDATGTYDFDDGFRVARGDIRITDDARLVTPMTRERMSSSLGPRYVGATQHCWLIQEGACGVKGCCFGNMCWEYAWDYGC
jgi:hypothetical protein